MSTIVTRSGKGSPLTHTEVDNNFTNLNTDKLQSGDTAASLTITSADINGGTIDGATIGASTASTGAFTTATASTSFASPVFKATSSAGGALQNSSGTNQLQWGGGGGNNLSVDVAININPANAQVAISPTGTGSVTINPATAGTINNMSLGATTASTAVVTTLTANTSVSTDTISEKTSAAGVTIDGVLLKDNSVSASSGFTQNSTFNSASTMGFKNRIINGAMVIDQRNAGASITPTSGQYSVDRWAGFSTAASKYSLQQNAGSVTPPVGFTNYLGATSLSAYSVGSGDIFTIQQRIEGFNTADLGWGTANAQTVTLSFWVRSSLTGTFGGAINNNTSRSYPFSYTINSANTWEQKSITIVGDTTGTWTGATNAASLFVCFGLGGGATYSGTAGAWVGAAYYTATGATSVVGTNGATFYITGVQLEKGSTATSFDYRPYGTELALCQRYYYVHAAAGSNQQVGLGYYYASGNDPVSVSFKVPMRIVPSLNSGSGTSYFIAYSNGGSSTSSSITIDASSSVNIGIIKAGTTGTAGHGMELRTNNVLSYVGFNAEL